MKMKAICYLLLIPVCWISCNKKNMQLTDAELVRYNNEYQIKIDSVINSIIPDKRLTVCEISINIQQSKIQITGYMYGLKYFNHLKNYISQLNNRNIEFNVVLLSDQPNPDKSKGIISNTTGNIRSKPKHSSELVTQALMGTPVKVFIVKNGWALIQTPDNYVGWIDTPALQIKSENEMQKWYLSQRIIYNQLYGFGYEKPDTKSQIISSLTLSNIIEVIPGKTDGFFHIKLPDNREAFIPKQEAIPLEQWLNSCNPSGQLLTGYALLFNGVSYLWGGTSAMGIDCSGFIKILYFMNGIIVQRDASQQTLYGQAISTQNNFNNLQVGDLMFFGNAASHKQPERIWHVGMYIGDKKFIHASGKVRISGLDSLSTNYENEYMAMLVRVRRYLGHVNQPGIEDLRKNDFYKFYLIH